MELFAAFPSGVHSALSHDIGSGHRITVHSAPELLNEGWRKGLGEFQLAEHAQARWFVSLLGPRPATSDHDRAVHEHDVRARRVIRALRYAGFPGTQRGFRLAGVLDNGNWTTRQLQAEEAHVRCATHTSSPWESGTFVGTLPSVVDRLNALHDASGRPSIQTHHRLLRCLRALEIAFGVTDAYERLPMFARVIEGLLVVETEGIRRHLRERLVQVVAAHTSVHALSNDIYSLRSKILHMDAWEDAFRPSVTDREGRAKLCYASAEVLACHLVYEILSSDALFAAYTDDLAIAAHWRSMDAGQVASPWTVLTAWDSPALLEWSSIPGMPPAVTQF